MLWTITKAFTISYGHRVFTQDLGASGLKPKCVNFHGHDSTVKYVLSADKLNPSTHMVLDYTLLKQSMFNKLDCIHAEDLDHKMILSTQDTLFHTIVKNVYNYDSNIISKEVSKKSYFLDNKLGLFVVDFVPTAETLSTFLLKHFKQMLIGLEKEQYKLGHIVKVGVEFNETADSTCLIEDIVTIGG